MLAAQATTKWLLCNQCGRDGKIVPADIPESVRYLCDECAGSAPSGYVPLSDERVHSGNVPDIEVSHRDDKDHTAGRLLVGAECHWDEKGRTKVRAVVPDPDLMANAAAWLVREMDGLKQGRMQPERDYSLDASHFVYNVATQALCFDFTPALIDAEMTRIRHGGPAPLKIGFVSGPSGDVNMFAPMQATMFNKVIRPMLKLIGAVESDDAKRGCPLLIQGYGPVTAAARAGEKVPRFHSTVGIGKAWAQKPVIITLRECTHCPERNSSMQDWLAFAKHLTARGQHVIFVRDTSFADEPLPYETFPAASRDIQTRMALYEQAACLFFVSNGPWNFGLFSHRPYATFINAGPADPCNSIASWRDMQGVPVGTQFPWAHDQQRIFWQPDTYRNLCNAWDTLGLP